MKKFLIALVAILLIASMLFSCKKDPEPNPDNGNNGGTDEGGGSTVGSTDNGTYMKDAVGVFVYGPNRVFTENTNGAIRIGADMLPQVDFNGSTRASLSQSILNSMQPIDSVYVAGRSDIFPVYGMYAGAAHEYVNFAPDLASVGITTIRTNRGGMSDESMRAFCENNISVMITSGVGFSTYFTGSSMTNTNSQLWQYSYYNFKDFLEKAVTQNTEFLEKYGPNGTFFDTYTGNYNPIRYIEVCNEPNFQYIFPIKRENGSDDANNYLKSCVYALLQIVTYHTVKSVCPDVQVVGMGAGGAGNLDLRFIEDVLKMDNTTCLQMSADKTTGVTLYDILNDVISKSEIVRSVMPEGIDGVTNKMGIDTVHTMDVLSTHPYNEGVSPFGQDGQQCISRNLFSIRTILAEKGVDYLPIWFTECGWNITNEEGGLFEGGKHTQLEQAEMEVQYYLYALRNGVDRIMYMSTNDTDGCCYGQFQASSGQLGVAGSTNKWVDADWRLCLYAIQTMVNKLPNPEIKSIVEEKCSSDGSTCTLVYTFSPYIGAGKKDYVTTVLSPMKAAEVSVAWDYDYALVTDLFGATQMVKAVDGKVTVNAGPAILYLEVPTMQDYLDHGMNPTAETGTSLETAWLGEKYEL